MSRAATRVLNRKARVACDPFAAHRVIQSIPPDRDPGTWIARVAAEAHAVGTIRAQEVARVVREIKNVRVRIAVERLIDVYTAAAARRADAGQRQCSDLAATTT